MRVFEANDARVRRVRNRGSLVISGKSCLSPWLCCCDKCLWTVNSIVRLTDVLSLAGRILGERFFRRWTVTEVESPELTKSEFSDRHRLNSTFTEFLLASGYEIVNTRKSKKPESSVKRSNSETNAHRIGFCWSSLRITNSSSPVFLKDIPVWRIFQKFWRLHRKS
jgi:hypothetical protein